jgi:transposase
VTTVAVPPLSSFTSSLSSGYGCVCSLKTVVKARQRQNTIRGLLKTFGLVVARGSKGLFPVRVREQIAGNPALIAIIEPMLAVWHAIRDQVAMLDRQMLARARNDQVARRLMTIPGVGVVIALAYTAAIDDPERFRRSVSVGAYLGLTPRRYQSGEVDTTGHISKCGDRLLRGYLYEAAQCCSAEMPALQP